MTDRTIASFCKLQHFCITAHKTESRFNQHSQCTGYRLNGYIISEESEDHIISGKTKAARPPLSASNWFEKLQEHILKEVIFKIS